MSRPIQGLRLWYATHACVWWMLFDSLNIVCAFLLKKRLVWVRHLLGQVVYSMRAHLGSCYLHWMPLNPDMFVLHDWLTGRVKITAWLRVDPLNFCTSRTLSRMNTPSFPFPSFIHSAFYSSALCTFSVFVHHIFGCCFVKALFAFPWKQGLFHHQNSYYCTYNW